MTMRTGWLATVIVVLSTGVVSAQTVMTDDGQMTLYTFDKDEEGKSACYDDCAKNWPPYIGAENETKGEGWTLVARDGGAMQWAYDGKPTYLFMGDKKPGDTTGDGKGGVWHVLKD